jgi:LPXTG-motif cell wall-anchored protein
MKYMITFILLLTTTSTLAKRIAAPAVSPVEHDGIHYTAPNQDGRVAYIEARDIQTEKQLWVTPIFHNTIKPWLEEDVQWVFVKKLEVVQDKLVVTDERGRSYKVDLKTGHVQQSILPSILGIACVAIAIIAGIWIIKRKTVATKPNV